MKRELRNQNVSTNYVNLERLTFLVDGVFAITMTLLVLELRPPESITTNLGGSLLAMLPRLYIYFIAFYSWTTSVVNCMEQVTSPWNVASVITSGAGLDHNVMASSREIGAHLKDSNLCING